MNIKSIILSLLLLPSSLLAQTVGEGQVLTLDSCLTMALRNNRQIKEAALQTQQYRHTKKSYLANYFPNIKGTVIDYQNFAGDRSLDIHLLKMLPQATQQTLNQVLPAVSQMIYDVFGKQVALENLDPTASIDYKIGNVFAAGFSVTQPIYMGGKITAAYKMSKLGEQMARVNESLTEDQVIVETHEAYALLLQATELHQVALKYDSLLAKLQQDVTNAERHGLCSHNDVLKVQVKKNEAELQIAKSHNGMLLAQMNLCHYVGVPLDHHVSVQEVNVEGLDPYAGTADVTNRPEYSLLEMKTQLAAQQVKLTRSDFLPQLGVMATWGYAHGVKVMDDYMFNRPGGSLMANLTVPLYHANEAQHKVKAAKLELERTRLEQEDLIEKMNLEMQQACNRMNESLLEVALTRKNLEQAEENLRASRKSYDHGLESLTNLLEAQTLWQQAYARKAMADAELVTNIARYKKACGVL